MKKFIIKLVGIACVVLLFGACKAKKGGCGLTSDASKIEQTVKIQKISKANV